MYRAYAPDPQMRINLGHPPPAGAAAGQRPPQDRAAERPAVLAAGHAGPLLRRRDRHGRQHLPRRPRTACARRCSGAPIATPASRAANPQQLYLPVDHRPRVPLRGGQRRGPAGEPALAAVVDEAPHRAAQAATRPSAAASIEFLDPRQPARPRLRARVRRRDAILVVANLSRFVQHVELDLRGLRGPDAGRAVRPDELPARSASGRYFLTPRRRTASSGSRSERSASAGRDGGLPARRASPTSPRLDRPGAIGPERAPRCATALRACATRRRWFRGKARDASRRSWTRSGPGRREPMSAPLALSTSSYADGEPEALPRAARSGADRERSPPRCRTRAIARVPRSASAGGSARTTRFTSRTSPRACSTRSARRRRWRSGGRARADRPRPTPRAPRRCGIAPRGVALAGRAEQQLGRSSATGSS